MLAYSLSGVADGGTKVGQHRVNVLCSLGRATYLLQTEIPSSMSSLIHVTKVRPFTFSVHRCRPGHVDSWQTHTKGLLYCLHSAVSPAILMFFVACVRAKLWPF